MSTILLTDNNGYKWCNYGEINFKGYFIINGDLKCHVYRGEEACKVFETVRDFDDFVKILPNLLGSWAVVINNNDSVFAAVDIARSIPLYYSYNGDVVSDSAEEIRIKMGIEKDDVDLDNLTELYTCYYLYGEKTVYHLIMQLDLGEAVLIDNSVVKKQKYFYHINRINNSDKTTLLNNIEIATNNTFNRLKAVIGNRPVVLSMSGGYDSRFIGCMLKNIGIDDVSCYTYGKATSFEVIQSKKNAEALGFRWTCVEMTDKLQARNLDEVGQRYFDYYKGHDFTAYMQNFTAVRKLHEDGWFKPNSVFLTGLCGDMPTGAYLTAYDTTNQYTYQSAVNYLYNLFYADIDYSIEKENSIKDRIKVYLDNLPIKIEDYNTWQSAIDCFTTGTSHSHWFMHMNSVHSFFGYEWLLPYWDQELLMAWYSVPPALKIKQKLYEDWLMDVICQPYGLSQKKIYGGYSKKHLTRQIQYTFGSILNFVFLHLGIPFKRKQDFSNFAPLELELFKNIKTRSSINYRKAGMMRLLAIYLIEKRYGAENLKRACKRVRLTD